VWDLTAGRRIFGPTRDPNPGEVIFGPVSTAGKVNSAALAPDGRKLAIAIEASGTIVAWDVDTGKVLHHNKRFRGYLSQIAFSTDGHRLLIYSSDNLTRVFDAETGVPIGPAVRQPSYNYATAVSPDGRRIVTVDFKVKLLRVMDVDRGERLLSIPFGESDPPASMWFDSAGASVNAQLMGGMAVTYPLPRLRVPLADAGRLVRFLTGEQIDDTDGIEFVDQRTFSKEPERYCELFREWKGLQVSAR
jgi:WD40 repeat protein